MNEKKVTAAIDLIRQGQTQAGMALMLEELLENPNDWRIHYHMGFAWRLIGDMDKSIFSYVNSCDVDPPFLHVDPLMLAAIE